MKKRIRQITWGLILLAALALTYKACQEQAREINGYRHPDQVERTY